MRIIPRQKPTNIFITLTNTAITFSCENKPVRNKKVMLYHHEMVDGILHNPCALTQHFIAWLDAHSIKKGLVTINHTLLKQFSYEKQCLLTLQTALWIRSASVTLERIISTDEEDFTLITAQKNLNYLSFITYNRQNNVLFALILTTLSLLLLSGALWLLHYSYKKQLITIRREQISVTQSLNKKDQIAATIKGIEEELAILQESLHEHAHNHSISEKHKILSIISKAIPQNTITTTITLKNNDSEDNPVLQISIKGKSVNAKNIHLFVQKLQASAFFSSLTIAQLHHQKTAISPLDAYEFTIYGESEYETK